MKKVMQTTVLFVMSDIDYPLVTSPKRGGQITTKQKTLDENNIFSQNIHRSLPTVA